MGKHFFQGRRRKKIVIPFSKPSIAGNELEYIQDAFASGKTCGDGKNSSYATSFSKKDLELEKCC